MKIIKETASLLTRDGVRLDADIYYPDTTEKLPILLMRQPYGRAIASTVVYAHPSWYAKHGYCVVIQDVRGRGTSEGEFKLFASEIDDGIDTINWVTNLPQSNGNVGMYGFSYQGMTQLYAASVCPPALKTICPAMIAHNLYADLAYEGGAFCWQLNLAWALQLATESARLKGDKTAYKSLSLASQNLPLFDDIPVDPDILKTLAPDSFYHDWLAHDQPDEYWKSLSPNITKIDLPILHIGGWFDSYLRGTLNFYQKMSQKSQQPQHLIVGAWAHLPWGRIAGSVDFGQAAATPIDQLQIRWFDQFLKEKDTGTLTEKPITLFEMGSNQWRHFETLSLETPHSYYLESNGLASLREDAGILSKNCPQNQAEDVFVHDPWRPVPALGGHATLPAGCFERSTLDCRSDIVTYTSEPLAEDLHLLGGIKAIIYCTADTPSFDLCAVLSDVRPDGKVYNITQGYQRIHTPQTPIKISLQPTCVRIAQHHCLRLSLSAACFPAYPVNPGIGLSSQQTHLMDAQIITLTVKCGGDFPSHLDFYSL